MLIVHRDEKPLGGQVRNMKRWPDGCGLEQALESINDDSYTPILKEWAPHNSEKVFEATQSISNKKGHIRLYTNY